MSKVLIIVTSANKRENFENSSYNSQEIGLSKALIKMGYECGIAYYGGKNYMEGDLNVGVGNIKLYLLKGVDFLKTTVFKDYSALYDEYDILLPISYDHYETHHIAMKYPNKTAVYHGTYYAEFNKRYNFKCKIFDKFLLKGYRKNNTLFITKNNLSRDFLNEKGLTNTRVAGVGFDPDQMSINEMFESDLSSKIKTVKDDGFKIILYIGRIEPRRNTLFLLETFNKVKCKTKSKLVMVGKGSAEYVKSVQDYIDNNNLHDDVILVERLEQKYLPLIYDMSDVFLLPTSYEIFGMVILEAMYFGVPVLTTLNGGSDILIENNKTGFIIPELDSDKWASKCTEILSGNNDALIEDAHSQIANNFVWDSIAHVFDEGFKSLA